MEQSVYQVFPIKLFLSVACLVKTKDHLILIDTGLPWEGESLLSQMEIRGHSRTDLDLVIITHAHPDHAGCLAHILSESGAKLAAHPLMAEILAQKFRMPVGRECKGRFMSIIYRPFLPFFPRQTVRTNVLLEEGSRLDDYGLPATVWHTPGHTIDSITLVLDDGTAFAGDLLVAVKGILVPQPYFIEDDEALAQSIERAKQWHIHKAYSGHFGEALPPTWP